MLTPQSAGPDAPVHRLTSALRGLFRRSASTDGGGAAGVRPSGAATCGLGVSELWGVDVLRLATAHRCIKLLAESVAALPLRAMGRADGTEAWTPDWTWEGRWLVSTEPNPDTTAFDFWSQAVQQMLVEGDAYVLPSTAMGRLTRLDLCGPRTVSHDVAAGTYTVCDTVQGLNGTFVESEVVHFKGAGRTPGRGDPMGAVAVAALRVMAAGDTEARNRMTPGGGVRGIITGARQGTGAFGQLDPVEMGQAALDVETEWRNGRNIVCLDADAKFQQTNSTSADMQLMEVRRFAVRDVCRFFGVHPSFVFDDSATNYKSAEQANAFFLSSTLNPLLLRLENELTRKLVPRQRWPWLRLEFDRSAMMAADATAVVSYLAQAVAAGVMTPNEARARFGAAPVAGGDAPLISANLRPVSQAGAKK